MENEAEKFKSLLRRYEAGECSDEEIAWLESWYLQLNEQERAKLSRDELDEATPFMWDAVQKQTRERQPIQLWPRIAIAASLLFLLSFGGYFLLHKSPTINPIVQNQRDLPPGSNKAILTLSNGKQISLSDAKNGTIASDDNTIIKKASNGTISYHGNVPKGDQLVYNTITTPRGGQWPVIVLPDGSKAILDAASSIRYPVAFTGKERKVEITGQVYFEVVHNGAKPFRVSVKGQTVEDIGTQFNINAYDDEPNITTTLVEGSIRVSTTAKSEILKPGQQAIATLSANTIKVQKANIDQTIAWKNGKFFFERTNLRTMMRQVARWYDLDVVYKGNIANDDFGGEIPRAVNLSEMLKILKSGDVHYQIDLSGGKRILIITP